MCKLYLRLFCFIFILTLPFNPCLASVQKDLWPIWVANNPLNEEVITHEEWRDFLKHNLNTNAEGITLVAYKNISDEDRQLLNSYIHRLALLPIDKYNRQEQLAYWLNLYNALTVQVIIKNYPVSSIQDINISPGLFSIGPWGANLVRVNRQLLSLDEIENRIIRPIWNDPRILYALNNASIGAANMHHEPFVGTKLEEQLNLVAETYINSLRGVQIIENKLIVSKIYEWFQEDFGGSEKLVIKHLMQFAKNPLQAQLKQNSTIDRYMYNWHLNNSTPS